MIVTTTQHIEGRKIVEYKGLVFGEVVAGIDFVKDFKAGLSNFFGGRSQTYEEELIQARDSAIAEITQRAMALGADAIVGVAVDYEMLGANNGMMMVTVSGTAVRTA
ncbi:heavy metal-binding domain-containing protein [Candidatus Soleaferrea massiliensis]|uniref:heavy metal-binding domain-containing protein n=1 Tax=Candidatus Soleaferrea massiliensis TaxID=1470354 RepID=UPI0005905EC8|nr:heavy metal-binding domain-containing protein [Candidatus Soleaferrea massiliensis]